MNLPTEVMFNNSTSQVIKYTYDATGVKLKKEIPGKVTEYAGNFVYEKLGLGANVLQFFNHPEGYVSYDGGQFNYIYNYKDHLGNVRLSYTDANQKNSNPVSLQIIQEKNYYPFGLAHQGYNGGTSSLGSDAAKRYGFGGKELQNENISGNILDWYDVSARNYDPALGRWMNIDPLAENSRRWTPYNYAYNNPVYFVDPDGMQATDWYKNSEGAIVFDKNVNSQEDLDNAGIEGEYIAEEFVGIDQNQGVRRFNEDGTVESSSQEEIREGDTVVAVESSSGEITQDNALDKGRKFTTEAGIALAATQADSPVPGPGDIIGAAMLINAVKNLIVPNQGRDVYTTLEFSKKRSKDSDYGQEAEHTKGKRASTRTKHEKGQSRKGRDKGGEKGDKRRKRYK